MRSSYNSPLKRSFQQSAAYASGLENSAFRTALDLARIAHRLRGKAKLTQYFVLFPGKSLLSTEYLVLSTQYFAPSLWSVRNPG